LKKALAERVLNAEMDHYLAGEEPGNRRNGYGKKTVITDTGQIELEVPRDRQARFDPQLIAKYQRRFPGFDDKIISMYARGMSTREIVGHLRDLYGIDISPDLISAVTDAVLEEVAAWQARPLEAIYPLVFFDALRVKIRDEGLVRNKAVHIALGVRADGTKEILGLWLEQNEGAKFWLRVMNELKNRGVEDVLIAVVDGLKGFPDAITAVFPRATVQTCIVHLLRHSLDFVSWKDRKPVAAALKDIYRAVDTAAGEAALTAADAARYGIDLEPNRPNSDGPESTDFHGVAVTYQTIAAGPDTHRLAAGRRPTLLIADEPHHMGDLAAWGLQTRRAFDGARFRLLLSGTPFRSDNSAIPWVTYDEDGLSRADYAYGYPQALVDRVCRPITFLPYDGEMEWISDGRLRSADFDLVLPAAEAAPSPGAGAARAAARGRPARRGAGAACAGRARRPCRPAGCSRSGRSARSPTSPSARPRSSGRCRRA